MDRGMHSHLYTVALSRDPKDSTRKQRSLSARINCAAAADEVTSTPFTDSSLSPTFSPPASTEVGAMAEMTTRDANGHPCSASMTPTVESLSFATDRLRTGLTLGG